MFGWTAGVEPANLPRDHRVIIAGETREGTAWLSRLLDKIVAGKGEKQDVDNVHQIARQMEMKTICALADGAAMPAKSYIEKFRADFDALVRG